jgi:hypothetical protein
MKNIPSHKRLRLASWIVLAAGLIAAAAIFIFTSPEVADPFGDPSLSKRYVHDLEVYGGRANVLQDELVRWFYGLWQGRDLAGTIACITGFTFLVMRLIVSPFHLNTPTTPDSQSSTQSECASNPVADSNSPPPPTDQKISVLEERKVDPL